jgi:beta-glucosidase
MTFPASEAQLPNPQLPGAGAQGERPPAFEIRYPEGSDAGYRWYAKTGAKPLYPFGYGLSYTGFRYSGLTVTGGKTLTARFTVTNTGARAGIDTPQLYLAAGPTRRQQRLLGWSHVALKPGERRTVTVTADPRLLASWDDTAHGWRLDPGAYEVFVGSDAMTPVLTGSAVVAGARLKP